MSNLPLTEHRLTWRMWHPVYVFATSKEVAIAEAIRTKPQHIPDGTELYYGPVAGNPVYVACPVTEGQSAMRSKFPKPSGDAITDRKRQNKQDAQDSADNSLDSK